MNINLNVNLNAPPSDARTATGPQWRAIVRLLRPRQAIKNLFCLAGVLFGPGRVTEPAAWGLDLATMGVFVLASSSVYVLNDLVDRRRDALHPRKRARPIASGAVSVPMAAAIAAAAALAAAVAAVALGPLVLACVLLYLANNVAYSFGLKHRPLFDVLCIALGFILRLLAGIYVLGDLPTTWIALCTFFLALFLGFSKRRAELAGLVPEVEIPQRTVLSQYTVPFLDSLVGSTAIMTVMCYALFTTTAQKNPTLVVTVPIVFYAVMHYKRLVMILASGEEPEQIVLQNRALVLAIALWLASYFAVTTSDIHLFR